MAVTYRIDAEKGIVRITVDGQPEPDEHAQVTRRWLADPDYVPGMAILLDNRGRKHPSEPARVRQLADETLGSRITTRGIRVAIVVASDAEFGMARMYEAMAADSGMVIATFRDLDEAEAWLTEPPEGDAG